MRMDYLLHHLFITSRDRLPDKEAVVDGKAALTYNELFGKAGQLANKLFEAGVKRGDRVAFFLDHNTEQAVSILAISSLGAVFVPVNALLYPEQVRHILCDSAARFLLTTKVREKDLDEILRVCIDLKEVILTEELSGKQSLIRDCASIENDLAAILYTSGSSGQPKGVMVSHKNLLAGCWIVTDYLQLCETDRLLGVLPLSFDYGLNQLITMLALGGTYYFYIFNFPNEIIEALKKYKITGFAGLPSIWAVLVRSTFSGISLPHLRYITNSGGAVPSVLLDKVKKSFPKTDIILMYGLTEAFRSTYLPVDELVKRPTSMGKAIPNTEIFVVSENGTLCKPDEIGELVHRGPTVSNGYWNRPEETANRFRPFPWDNEDVVSNERVVFSGDLVKYDDEGYLYFIGRNDAMIKCSGIRISPTEIEEVVFKTGLVKEAAAISLTDEIIGQVIKVFVVPVLENENQSKDFVNRIIDFCCEHMPNYMIPRYVELIDIMPKTVAGKVDYPALRSRDKQ